MYFTEVGKRREQTKSDTVWKWANWNQDW